MSALVECVPNFSEGRDITTINAIVASIAAVEGVRVLHVTSDYDHHRTVVTFVGTPSAVSEAAFQSIATAAQRINLDQHSGQHPRLGAADVVPFVPLHGMTLHECAALARQLGQRVGDELNLPVYLYEAAATRPERINLADVRRGGYEGLYERITQPDDTPDFGPSRVGNAGAVIIGARQPLIAFNVFLTTHDVSIAQAIARAIRHSSGGLSHVKALGLLVDGRAQVSMNLTDYQQTPLHVVIEAIRQEAMRQGVAIHSSQLIGLIPQQAVLQSLAYYLQLPDLSPHQVLHTTTPMNY